MNLQVRHPKARELALRIAMRDGVSMTEAVVRALESELKRDERKETLLETVQRVQRELRVLSTPGGSAMTKEDIDDMWGHPPVRPNE